MKVNLDILSNLAVLVDVIYDEQSTSSSASAIKIGKICQLLLSTSQDVIEQSGKFKIEPESREAICP